MQAFDEGDQRPVTGDSFQGKSVRITNIELTATRRTLRARRYGYSNDLRSKNAGIIVANQRYTFHLFLAEFMQIWTPVTKAPLGSKGVS